MVTNGVSNDNDNATVRVSHIPRREFTSQARIICGFMHELGFTILAYTCDIAQH